MHKRGITIFGSFIFGVDGDDLGTFKRTVDFVNASKIDAALHNIFTPFPGTKLYDQMQRQGRIHNAEWSDYDVCHSVIHPEGMTSEELQREVFDFPFVVSGSTWLTALSKSKGYRTRNGMKPGDFLRIHQG